MFSDSQAITLARELRLSRLRMQRAHERFARLYLADPTSPETVAARRIWRHLSQVESVLHRAAFLSECKGADSMMQAMRDASVQVPAVAEFAVAS